MTKTHYDNKLYYGDNLDVLIKYIKDESIDLCYIDPPFNSKRNYNQIYNNIGKDDQAQAQAFVDTWTWGQDDVDAYFTITNSNSGVFPKQCVELIIGLRKVLGDSSLMAYLVSMTMRIAQIYRVLKPTGSFYLHCDPTASHYLKLVIDSIFCSQGGEYLNEIVWCYGERSLSKRYFNKKHDIIFLYSKSENHVFNYKEVAQSYSASTIKKFKHVDKDTGKRFRLRGRNVAEAGPLRRQTDIPLHLESEYTYRQYLEDSDGVLAFDWVEIDFLNQAAAERLGYPTQKPESLLELFIKASSNEGDTVLDAFCGCGTTVAVAQRLNRKWIGIDITYQAIAVVIKRLEDSYGQSVKDNIELNGIPRGMNAVIALVNKKDDRLRKEFEKWAVLTYSDNKAMINDKKGSDGGIDGTAFMLVGHSDHKQVLFSVKSGNVGVNEIKSFCHTINSTNAAMGIFLTLLPPTKPMIQEAVNMGKYTNPLTNQEYQKIQIVTIEEVLDGKRLNLPQAVEVLKAAKLKKDAGDNSLGLNFD